jgi:hypothetical protein
MVGQYIEKLQLELRDVELRLLTAIARGRLCPGCLNRTEECICNEEANYDIPRRGS